MQCPVDGETLVMTERSGVEIDYCPKCRGVWLDRGELDKIIERADSGDQGRPVVMQAPHEPVPVAQQPFNPHPASPPPAPPPQFAQPTAAPDLHGRPSDGWQGRGEDDRRYRGDDYRGRDEGRRYRDDDDDDYGRHRKRKKRDSFLSELFDFD